LSGTAGADTLRGVTNHLHRGLLLLTQLAINALALVVVDAMFAKVTLAGWQTVTAAAVLLALVNTYLRPLLLVLTLPFNILSLGLFTLVVNAALLKLVSWLLPSFQLDGFWTAVGAALVISVVSFLLNWFLRPDRLRVNVQRHW
jgi:putative membrane protein